ncbi:hypothetical protein [Halovivax limisalsi]|uniref:hypothetical protein n=1 Tax=Halovivax limisalsi TaxID=1453760 RepID=UPI001FFD94D0|nr:hypothetical protein [Halovivax limisalsi]
MEATIVGENEEGIGVDIVDNNTAEHEITFEKESYDIVYHHCEAYHDKAAERTPEENEYSNQARRYAQYYVFQERGYDTVKPRYENPIRLLLIWRAVDEMDRDEFEANFADLYQQLKSYHDAGTEKVVHAPADSQGEDYHLYRKELYLGVDPFDTDHEAEARELADRYGLGINQDTVKETPVASLTADGLDAWTAFGKEFFDRISEDDVTDLVDGAYVDTITELQIAYLDHDGRRQVTTAIGPDREPDAIVEMPPLEWDSFEEFRAGVEWNLICRIRDCFVRMGVTPPEDFQVLGTGSAEAVAAYERVDFYPDYIMPQEDGTFHGKLHDRYFGDDSILGSVRSLLG